MEELRLKDIIVIDDNEEELDAIVRALRKAKQFVIPVLYGDDSSSDAMDIVNSYYSMNKIIRTIITDINLIPGATFNPETAAKNIADSVLSRLVVKNSINYILYVWTGNDTEEQFETFKYTLYDTLQKNFIKCPVNIVKISKNSCKTNSVFDSDKIIKIIRESIVSKENKAILQLIDWEKSCEVATAQMVDMFLDFENPEYILKKLLASFGGSNALSEPEQIINVLLMLLKDNLNTVSYNESTRKIWRNLFDNVSDSDLDTETIAKVNTCLHIDTVNINSDIICPGDFFEICDNNILNYCFFKAMNKQSKEYYIDKCFDINISVTTKKEKTNIRQEIRQQSIEFSKMGLLEISQSCDFAQSKKISNLFVLSFIIPKIKNFDFLRFNSEFNKNRGVSKSIFDPLLIIYEEKAYYLFVDAKYLFSLNAEFINNRGIVNQARFKKLFRLRESFLQSWIQKIANYNSRIGTINL